MKSGNVYIFPYLPWRDGERITETTVIKLLSFLPKGATEKQIIISITIVMWFKTTM